MPIFMKMDGIDGDIGRGSNAGNDHTATGHECLVFFLGGMPDDFGGFLGGVTVAAGDISDGTSNTFLFTEVHPAAGDGDGRDFIGNPEDAVSSGYVLTSIEHTAIDTSYGAVRTGGWIFDVSYEQSTSHREGDALSTQTNTSRRDNPPHGERILRLSRPLPGCGDCLGALGSTGRASFHGSRVGTREDGSRHLPFPQPRAWPSAPGRYRGRQHPAQAVIAITAVSVGTRYRIGG